MIKETKQPVANAYPMSNFPVLSMQTQYCGNQHYVIMDYTLKRFWYFVDKIGRVILRVIFTSRCSNVCLMLTRDRFVNAKSMLADQCVHTQTWPWLSGQHQMFCPDWRNVGIACATFPTFSPTYSPRLFTCLANIDKVDPMLKEHYANVITLESM